MLKILVIGAGGREHAIAWKLSNSPSVEHVYLAPGNPGACLDAKLSALPIQATDTQALMHFCQTQTIDFTIVGPEAPLAAGLVDQFQAEGLPCFGPTQAAAQLESSKVFCKEFLERHQIPTAKAASFDSLSAAKAYLHTADMPIVIKADGLAAGKGVIIAETLENAEAAIDDLMETCTLGQAGQTVLIEQFLRGEEASFMVMVDAKGHCLPLTSSQDHKAKLDRDLGPNTGGMGACTPAAIIDETIHDRVMRDVIAPTLQGMADEGHPYQGFLYAGLMINDDGTPYVLEYNCRLGDPETQPIMMRLQSDLADTFQAALEGDLDTHTLSWDERPALGIVLCADGYPESTRTGDPIHGLATLTQNPDQKCFFAGVKTETAGLITAGGRVLCLTTLAENLTEAQKIVYAQAKNIHWPGIHFRSDIGAKSIAREIQQEQSSTML